MTPSCKRASSALLLLLLVAATGTRAQSDRTRSETGRHRPKPPPAKTEDAPARPAAGPATVWFTGLGAGFQGGGELWHVHTLNQAPIAWESLVPFTSERFNASLDNDFALGVFLGRHLSERWSVRLDIGGSRMDVAAEALQGQQGAVFLYDRLTFFSLGIAAELRLVRLPSYPYLSLGPVLHRISSAQWDELDQTSLGARLGFGYLYAASPEFGLRAEIRLGRAGFDTGDFVPRSAGPGEPEVQFDPVSAVTLFEAVLAVQMNL